MAVHAVCETTNLRAVHYAERIWDAVADFDVDNGIRLEDLLKKYNNLKELFYVRSIKMENI